MAAHFKVDSSERLVTVRFDSNVTVQDVREYLAKLKSDATFEATFRELVDLTQVVSSDLDFQAAMMLARDIDPFSRETRRAFVAPRAATSATVHMYQMARGDKSIAVFRTMDEAKDWLGIQQTQAG
ncbi:MAG TPA: hypothetical protein VEG68_18700 [Terriglobales bacterium]|nr:hypothetical protein [Terriglobales bacterium]